MRIGLAMLVGLAVIAASTPAWAQRSQSPRAVYEVKTLPKNDVEKRILEVIERVGRDQRAGNMIVPEEDGRLLRAWTEAVGAKNVVEIGTSVGYSGLWFCLALKGTGGKLTTFDIDERRAAMAKANFEAAGVADIVTIVLGDAHETVKDLKDPIDVLFLDADKSGYLDYLQKLLPLVRPGGIVIAHNMTPNMADRRFVEAITTNPELETVFLHMDGSGVSISVKKH